jgi:glycosyltransferase involved in cell wall biosynthesis
MTTPSRGLLSWDAELTMTPAAEQVHHSRHMIAPYEEGVLDLTIFISCYNESALIARTLDTVVRAAREVGLSYEIIVIDDASRDNSPELIIRYMAEHPEERITLRVNRKNKGLAQNYIDAAFLGIGKYYRLSHGDNSEPQDSIATILKSIGEADIIIPYYLSSEGKSNWRQTLSKSYTALVNFLSGYRLHYYNGQAIHLRHNVMRWHPSTAGFGFQADILCQLLDVGFTYKEVGVITIEQRQDRSHAITFRNFLSVAHTLMEIGNRRLSNRLFRRR